MKFRKPLKITSRTSSITNAFVQSIIPNFEPTEEEIDKALTILGMTRDKISCAYCGDKASDWDHLRPLVKDKRPTGYITELGNMVPACGTCNQSKSGSNWQEWMFGGARNSPTTRGIPDLDIKIGRLKAYEKWAKVRRINFRQIVEDELWNSYWKRLEEITNLMVIAQNEAESIRLIVKRKI